MPLIFAENEFTESGIVYEDETGKHYQFPAQYRQVIKSDVPFIYYRGRKAERGRRIPVYFGTGRVGAVNTDPNDDKRSICTIIDYRAFEPPVPFKRSSRDYLEPAGTRPGYFQPGVRSVSQEIFNGIIDAADELRLHEIAAKSAARLATVQRMVQTAVQTTANANGQSVLRKIKNKQLGLTTAELARHVDALIEKQQGRCAISGIILQFDSRADDPELVCSLDRVDSSGHYTPGNLQVICKFLNRWKNAESDLEFRRLLRLLQYS